MPGGTGQAGVEKPDVKPAGGSFWMIGHQIFGHCCSRKSLPVNGNREPRHYQTPRFPDRPEGDVLRQCESLGDNRFRIVISPNGHHRDLGFLETKHLPMKEENRSIIFLVPLIEITRDHHERDLFRKGEIDKSAQCATSGPANFLHPSTFVMRQATKRTVKMQVGRIEEGQRLLSKLQKTTRLVEKGILNLRLQPRHDPLEDLPVGHHEGMVGIHHCELSHSRQSPTLHRDNPVVLTLQQKTEKRNEASPSHNDINPLSYRKIWYVLADLVGRQAHPAGTEGIFSQRGIRQPVNDLAAMVGRGQHHNPTGHQVRPLRGETPQHNSTHRVGHKVGRLLARRKGCRHLLDQFGQRLAKRGIGNAQGLKADRIQMPGKHLHGPDTAPQAV